MHTARQDHDHLRTIENAMSATDTAALPDYAPVPRSALGPALNEQGYYVGRVERNLYWITDGTYQCAFLTTSDGVVLLDARWTRSRRRTGSATRSITSSTRTITPTTSARRRCSTRTSRASGTRRRGGG